MKARSKILLASAGSGKTFRLTSHFLQLIARGAPPERILASTFTRKAAGEILGRVFSRLAAAAADEQAARRLAAELESELPRARALELLAQLARSVHRFRVRTLDAFFGELARELGPELGLPPDWRVADEVELVRAREASLARAFDGAEPGAWSLMLNELERGRSSRSVHALLERLVDAGVRLQLEAGPHAWEVPTPPPAPAQDALRAAVERFGQLEPPRTKTGAPNKPWAKALPRVHGAALDGDWAALLDSGLGKGLLRDGRYSNRAIDPPVAEPLQVLLDQSAAVLGAQLRAQNEACGRLLALYDAHRRSVQSSTRRLSFDDVAHALAEALAPSGAGRADESRAWAPDLALRLDGAIDHLLLDEFQDTSPVQWRVLRPFAVELAADGSGERSFFCVGDVKQSIYGWRSAEPRLLESLPARLHLEPEPMNRSWRSAPVVLAAVNRVLHGVSSFEGWKEEDGDALTARAFADQFREHVAAHPQLGGVVRVRTCAGGASAPQRWRACVESAAQLVAEIRAQAPWASIAVLLRRNRYAPPLVARLRELGIAASDEGGNPLTDAISVQAALATLHWLEHPGDGVARLHAAASVFGPRFGLQPLGDDEEAARAHARARRELLALGLAEWLAASRDDVAEQLGGWEARRFGQLVDVALGFDPAAPRWDFVERVRRVRVDDPSSARVKVMTIHAAKGLEFDAVVLPELDHGLAGRADTFVARRAQEDPEREYEVLSYGASEPLRKLLARAGDARIEAAARASRQRSLRDDLSGLYVALTRARHRLELVLWPEGASNGKPRLSAAGIVRHAFSLGFGDLPPSSVVAEQEGGSEDWIRRAPSAPAAPPRPPLGALRWAPPRRARELERVSPSELHELAQRSTAGLFAVVGQEGRRRGGRWHAWFECVEWLDTFAHSDTQLLALAKARGLGGEGLAEDLRAFRAALAAPNLTRLLTRPPSEVELWRERRFRHVVGSSLHSGAFDRVVVTRRNAVACSAHVVDFKSDRRIGDAAEHAERYRSQLELYRRAVARMLALPLEVVRATLVFADEDRLVEL